MPLIDFHALCNLVTEYEPFLTAATPQTLGAPARCRLEDVPYTVCVYTDIREPREAMSRARRLLLDRARSAQA
ncbi:DUF5133 domain-containing protein [Actinacidiphila oryziradicis]|nr:DUF5133 domain-containing protein [Actinacidiphila oryziradicis]